MSLSTTSSQYYVMLYIIQVIKGDLVSTFKNEEEYQGFCKVKLTCTYHLPYPRHYKPRLVLFYPFFTAAAAYTTERPLFLDSFLDQCLLNAVPNALL